MKNIFFVKVIAIVAIMLLAAAFSSQAKTGKTYSCYMNMSSYKPKPNNSFAHASHANFNAKSKKHRH